MTATIVDTSALYALADRNDFNHARAAGFLKSLAPRGSLVLCNHVFDETMTLVKGRLGVPAALQLGLRVRNSRFIELVVFTTAEEHETWQIFSRYDDKQWSYTDCACLALARRRGIEQAFAFDHHFGQMGLAMVP